TAGDLITKIGDEPVATWQDARWVLLQHAVQRTAVVIEGRDSAVSRARRKPAPACLTTADLDSDFLRALGLTRFQIPLKPVIGSVLSGGAAERAGLKLGDEIVAINTHQIETWSDVVKMIRSRPGAQLTVEIRRKDGPSQVVSVTPETVAENGEPIGKIGAAPLIDKSAMAGIAR